MSRLRIKTRQEFADALRAMKYVAERQEEIPSADERLGDYALWHALLRYVNEAIAAEDWSAVRSLLTVYEGVVRVGDKSEMWDAMYVAFEEDVVLPSDPAKLRQLWLNAPRCFVEEIKHNRGCDRK